MRDRAQVRDQVCVEEAALAGTISHQNESTFRSKGTKHFVLSGFRSGANWARTGTSNAFWRTRLPLATVVYACAFIRCENGHLLFIPARPATICQSVCSPHGNRRRIRYTYPNRQRAGNLCARSMSSPSIATHGWNSR